MSKRWVTGALCAGILMVGAHSAGAQDTTFKVFWKDGIRMETSDGSFKAKIGGRMQYDAAFFNADPGLEAAKGDFNDGTELRRARLEVEALIYERFVFKTQYDFVDGSANIKDMYIGINGLPYVGDLKLGQVKEPFSIDELTSSKYDEFMEQAVVTIFAPSRNPGVSFQNAVLDERLTYAAGVFVDANDFGNSGANETYAFTGRVTGLPWYAAEDQLLHLGFNTSYRKADDTIQYRQRPEAHLAPRVVDTGAMPAESQWVFGPEAALVYGPFCLQAEWDMAAINSKSSALNAGTANNPNFSGYYVYVSYWLTGESRNYKTRTAEFDRVKPKRNLFQSGGWGAWEVLLRYSELDLSDGVVQSPNLSGVQGGKVSDITAGLNWEWNPNMRLMFNYVHANTDSVGVNSATFGTGGGNADIFETRVQADF